MASEYKPNLGVIPVTAATVTLNADGFAGRTITLDRAAGIVVTLPPATGSGFSYEIVARTSVTSNNYTLASGAGDFFIGVVGVLGSATAAFAGNGSTHNRINQNGSTTGGLLGSRIVVQDIAPNRWAVSGDLNGSGTAATPFAAV